MPRDEYRRASVRQPLRQPSSVSTFPQHRGVAAVAQRRTLPAHGHPFPLGRLQPSPDEVALPGLAPPVEWEPWFVPVQGVSGALLDSGERKRIWV